MTGRPPSMGFISVPKNQGLPSEVIGVPQEPHGKAEPIEVSATKAGSDGGLSQQNGGQWGLSATEMGGDGVSAAEIGGDGVSATKTGGDNLKLHVPGLTLRDVCGRFDALRVFWWILPQRGTEGLVTDDG